MKSGDVRTALSLCHKTSHPLARILVPILNNPKQSREAMESAISVEVKKVAPNIQKRTGYLQMIGHVATLVGLLGTIQGLIISFSSLSGVSAAAKAELLATGISTAMNTTAFGLIVAIPCLVCFAALANKETRILQKYEEVIGEVLHALLYEGNNRRNDPYAA